MSSNGTLVIEALGALAVLLRAYYGWYIAFIGALAVLLLALIAVLNTLYNRIRHPRED